MIQFLLMYLERFKTLWSHFKIVLIIPWVNTFFRQVVLYFDTWNVIYNYGFNFVTEFPKTKQREINSTLIFLCLCFSVPIQCLMIIISQYILAWVIKLNQQITMHLILIVGYFYVYWCWSWYLNADWMLIISICKL